MANPESRVQFPDGAGATQHRLMILPAGGNANVTIAGALVNQTIDNAGPADEDVRLGDYTVPVSLPAGDYVLQVQTSQPAVSVWSEPLAFSYTIVGVPGPVVIV